MSWSAAMLTLTCRALVIAIAYLSCLTAATPLDDYVNAPDDHYNWTVLTIEQRDKYTLHVLNMTSQKWMDESHNSRPIWWHYVVIVVPTYVKVKDAAILLIDGGDNRDKIPDESDISLSVMILVAISTRTVTVNVKQIPNQPILFKGDPKRRERSEDALLAWAWRDFLNHPSRPHSLVQLPMTKAVVRAMDTVTAYNLHTRQQKIDKYFITGASKRGWVAWLTAAVDSRIIGMAPIVFDLLSMEQALHHHYRTLGGWSFAFQDYYDANITAHLESDAFTKTASIIDPLVYKDRYMIPTYIIKATGDEFFLLDETRYFYNKLLQPTYLRVFPNCNHWLINQLTRSILGLRSFLLHLFHGATYPKVHWTMTSSNITGTIHVTMDREPLSVAVYRANTLDDKRRDFRLFARDPDTGGKMFQPVIWFEGQANQLTPTEYEATVRKGSGWIGFFIQMTFAGIDDSVLTFSTEVNVVPNTVPFKDCDTNCAGELV